MFARFLFLLSLTFSTAAPAAVDLPKALNESDRERMLQILGFGSQSKLLSSPVPLGGSEGFEVGLSSEYIPIDDLGALGDKQTNAQGEFNSLVLAVGKGLAHNVDTFFHFTPMPQGEGVFLYGGQLRWGFHEFARFPAVASVVVHMSGANYANLLDTRTTGADLVVTVAMEEAALYFGGGPIRSLGTFQGGVKGITAEGVTVDTDLSAVHTVFGLSIGFGRAFFALEIDRVEQSVYGGRLGMRF